MLNPARMLAFLEEKIRSLGTAACPPYHLAIVVGGTSAEYALKTAKYASARYLDTLPTRGSPAGHGFRDLELEQQVLEITRKIGHRRAVRRQVLLPRRAGDPAAPARRVLPGRDRGVVLGRPAGAGQDHRGRRVPRAARDRPGAVPARDRRRGPRRRRRADRPDPADGRDPRRAVQVPGQDPAVADRPDGRRPRHRARQDRGTPGRGRADAAVPARPRRLLRRPGQDPGGLRVRVVRADHRRPDGLLRRPVPGGRRVAGHAGQGQPVAPRSPTPASSTAGSTSARSAARRRGWPRTASPRSRCSSTPSSAWRRSGRSRSATSPRSSSSTTRATTSSPGPRAARRGPLLAIGRR